MSEVSLETCTSNLNDESIALSFWISCLLARLTDQLHTDTQTDIERKHYLRHSLHSLGGDKNILIIRKKQSTSICIDAMYRKSQQHIRSLQLQLTLCLYVQCLVWLTGVTDTLTNTTTTQKLKLASNVV